MRFDKKYLLILLIPLIAWGAVEWGNLTVKGNLLVGSAGELAHTIGGVSVLSKIEAQSQAGTDPGGIAVHRNSASDALGGHFLALRSRGTAAAPTIVSNDDIIMRLAGVAYDGTDYEFGSEIRFEVDGTPGSNDMPGRILFLVSPDGSGTQAEALRIGNDKKATFAGTIDTALSTAGLVTTDSSGVLSSVASATIAQGGTNNGSLGVTSGGMIYADGSKLMNLGTWTSAQGIRGGTPPTVYSRVPVPQRFTASGTYTPTSGAIYAICRCVGGGGGGGGSGTTTSGGAGGAGGTVTFGALVTCGGGAGGGATSGGTSSGGAGGTNTIATVTTIHDMAGSRGGNGPYTADGNTYSNGGTGGVAAFGGCGGTSTSGTPAAPTANSGCGGSGGGANTTAVTAGSGGGSGGYVEFLYITPASQTVTINTGGSAGSAGTSGSAGRAGATGYLDCTDYL